MIKKFQTQYFFKYKTHLSSDWKWFWCDFVIIIIALYLSDRVYDWTLKILHLSIIIKMLFLYWTSSTTTSGWQWNNHSVHRKNLEIIGYEESPLNRGGLAE